MKSGKCPKCGSVDVRYNRGSRYRGTLVMGIFSWVRLDDYICANCGYVEGYVAPEHLEKVRKQVPSLEVKPEQDG